MSSVVVSKEFIHLYNKVVDTLGYRAATDEQFYPYNIEMLQKVATINVDTVSLYGFHPTSVYGFDEEGWLEVYTYLLNFLKNRREAGKPLGWSRLWKDAFVREWNDRSTNYKPLPCRFDDSLLQYVESITLDIETFQSMQKAIQENLDD